MMIHCIANQGNPNMKPHSISRIARSLLASLLFLASPAALPYVVDVTPTAAGNPTGLWWNKDESGWGATVTQQSNIMFVTIYTYRADGTPVWYVSSYCAVAAAGCSGDLYSVDGGQPPGMRWSGTHPATRVGSVTLAFTDNNNGSMTLVIDGVASSKAITRQLFGAMAPAADGNRGKTELLLGGTWTFSFSRTVHFRFASIEASTSSDDYLAYGTNDTGEEIAGGFVSANGTWSVLDIGTATHDFYTFTFVDTNHVSGCYVPIDADTFSIGHCDPMTGSRSPPR